MESKMKQRKSQSLFVNGFATCKITLSIAIYKIGLEKSFDYNIVKRGIIMSIGIRWVGKG